MKEVGVWQQATENIAKKFLEKYFPDEVYGKDAYWADDNIGGVFCIQEYYYLSIRHMVGTLEANVSEEEYFKHRRK